MGTKARTLATFSSSDGATDRINTSIQKIYSSRFSGVQTFQSNLLFLSLPQSMLSAMQSHLLELSSSLQHLLGVTSHDLGVNLCRASNLSPIGSSKLHHPVCLSYLSCCMPMESATAWCFFSARLFLLSERNGYKIACRGQVNPFFSIAIVF